MKLMNKAVSAALIAAGLCAASVSVNVNATNKRKRTNQHDGAPEAKKNKNLNRNKWQKTRDAALAADEEKRAAKKRELEANLLWEQEGKALIVDIKITLQLLFEVLLRINNDMWHDMPVRPKISHDIGKIKIGTKDYHVYDVDDEELSENHKNPTMYYVLENLKRCAQLQKDNCTDKNTVALICLEMMQTMCNIGSFTTLTEDEYKLFNEFQTILYGEFDVLYEKEKDVFNRCKNEIETIIAENAGKKINELRTLAAAPIKRINKINKDIYEKIVSTLFIKKESIHLLTIENMRCMNNTARKALKELMPIIFPQEVDHDSSDSDIDDESTSKKLVELDKRRTKNQLKEADKMQSYIQSEMKKVHNRFCNKFFNDINGHPMDRAIDLLNNLEQDRLRQVQEEQDRLRQVQEEQDRLRQVQEEQDRLRQVQEEQDRLRQVQGKQEYWCTIS